mgnify:CR=1 FL=1
MMSSAPFSANGGALMRHSFTATWGNMLTEAQSLTTLEQMAWLWIPPGLMITITVLSINFLGDALRDALDPRLTR